MGSTSSKGPFSIAMLVYRSANISTGTPNRGTPCLQASDTIPTLQRILMGVVLEQYGNGGPTIGVTGIAFDIVILQLFIW